MKKKYTLLVIIIIPFLLLANRNPLHKSTLPDPVIITYNNPGDSTYYTLRDAGLEWYPTFSLYDYEHFNKNLLPDGLISFRNNPTHAVSGKILKKLMENLLQEIKAKKKVYKDFIPLKSKGFNHKKQAGLLVVKCKHYPFVVKLFMENPRSFIRPYNKGFEPACQFVVGGGITRHALGFTRIKNARNIKQIVQNDPELNSTVDVPRKWFWMPTKEEYFYIKGYNFEENPVTVKVPGVYAIIADAIEMERSLSLTRAEDKKLALNLSKKLDFTIDPHINNFVIEKGTHKIIIIDTEHFPSLVGYKEKPHITSYFSYYFSLAGKYLKDRYGRLKSERTQLHRGKELPYHTLS